MTYTPSPFLVIRLEMLYFQGQLQLWSLILGFLIFFLRKFQIPYYIFLLATPSPSWTSYLYLREK